MTGETWKPIPGFAGAYEVSDHGNVRSLRGWRDLPIPYPLTQNVNHKGYKRVVLSLDGKSKTWFVHVLVLLAFVGPKSGKLQTRHLNGNPADNRLSNLRYGTKSQNTHDQIAHGTHPKTSQTHCPANHPYEGENLYVSPRGERRCRACQREHQAKQLIPEPCPECGAMVSRMNVRKHMKTQRCRDARPFEISTREEQS